jgi:hypothetical protein
MPPRFDVTIFALGMMLLVGCAFAKWRPHPVLFLVDSVWFSWVAVNLTLGIVHGQSKGWLILVALMVWMAVIGRHRAQRERLQLLHRPLGSRRAGVTPATRHRAGIDPSHLRIRRAVHSDPSVRTQDGGYYPHIGLKQHPSAWTLASDASFLQLAFCQANLETQYGPRMCRATSRS